MDRETIYALCDEHGRIRYVGRTYKPLAERLNLARWPARADRRPVAEWMRANRASVTIRALEVLPGTDRRDRSSRERRWITRLARRGIPLLNIVHRPASG